MRIVVTGAEGFIGRHLVQELRNSGHVVDSVDRRDGDLSEPGVASYLVQRVSPDAVVHLAAQVGRQFGEIDPAFTIRSNAITTALVAQATADVGARLVYASSSEIYGDQGEDDVFESAIPTLPYNLYGLTKRWGEEVAQLYNRDTAIARLSMPYGPGLPPGKGRAAIVNFLYQAAAEKPITVHRYAERCWCWVGDTVRGVRLILESDQLGAFNVGRDDDCRKMTEVAKLAIKITGSISPIVAVKPPKNQVLVKRLRTDRLRALGWEPEVNLEEGMIRTYQAMARLGHLPSQAGG